MPGFVAVYRMDYDKVVKIDKKGDKWYVYRLRQVTVWDYDYVSKEYKQHEFVFEPRYLTKHADKPYKDDEVSQTPDPFYPHVKEKLPQFIKEDLTRSFETGRRRKLHLDY